MIISLGRQYVFVHIPKTGGTSLALALEQRAMKDDIMLGDTPKARRRRRRVDASLARGRLWKHSTLGDIDGLIARDVLGGLYAFTMVRNPWDRMVSYYHWLRQSRFRHVAVKLAHSLSFGDFATHPRICQSFRDHPAASYMQRADGGEQCNAYIRLEHFEQDAVGLADHLGFDLTVPLSNTSDRDADYRRYYTDRTADSIAECCAADIARFGYCFE